MGLAKHKFLKHVECRWLSLHPALLRILEQMNGLKRYFLTVLHEKQSSSTSNAQYIRIRRQLESKDLVAQIHFLVSVADIFFCHSPAIQNARNHDCQCERFETVTRKFTRHLCSLWIVKVHRRSGLFMTVNLYSLFMSLF